jgi:hypothetical protein
MKLLLRLLKWALSIIAVLAALAGVAFYAAMHRFYPDTPIAAYPADVDKATAQQQDFDYFRNYFDLDRAYTAAARAQAEKLLTEYRAQAGKLSDAQFYLAIGRMAALADNGHSRVHPGPLSRRNNRLPCRLYRFDDGYYVIRARPACSELLGAKLLQVDGHPIATVVDAMYVYFGGPRSHYDQFAAPFFLESPALLHAAGLASEADRVSLHVQLRDGSERDITIDAEPTDPKGPGAFGNEYLSPQRYAKEQADWQPLLPVDAKLPVFLRDLANPFVSEYWPEKATYFAQFRSNADEPGHPIGTFIAKVRGEIKSDRPRFIVVDLRFDQGGDFTKTASLMKHLTTLADSIEHVYVLTSAWTFSAGDVSLALAREHGGKRITVLGQPVGDRIRLWAEGGSLNLPHSGLSIGFATGLHDYSRSCFGEPGCFWVMYFFPMHVATLDPDIRVPYDFGDYVNLRDPVLERTLELAGASKTAQLP